MKKIKHNEITKVALYCRVSTKKQQNGMKQQISILSDMARDFNITKIYQDFKSANEKDNRMQYKQMKKDFDAKKFEILFITNLDRLHRNVNMCLEFVDEYIGEKGLIIVEYDTNDVYFHSPSTKEIVMWKNKANVFLRWLDSRK